MPRQQQTLFDPEPAPWELDDAAQQLVATVVLAGGPVGEFDYLVPEAFVTAGGDSPSPSGRQFQAGSRVRVPLGRGNRSVIGYCVAIGYKSAGGRKLKTITQVLDRQPLVSPAILRLTQWMADYYLCPWGQVLEAVVPAGVRQQAGTRDVTLLSVSADVAAKITQLKLSAKQMEVLRTLAASPRPLTAQQVAARAECTIGPINALRKKGFVTETVERLRRGEFAEDVIQREPPHELNDDQTAALGAIHDALQAAEHRTILIHGVTGSGKTEVYIRAIEEVVRFGRQAILLVPEISLTPQTVGRFRARFDRVAVLHSHQSDVERHEHWRRIARGEVEVVVGARSAVFAPTPHLGLIVLDEEHESTFKQESAPRYHARDVALRRATDQKMPLVLASATPSLESWHRAQRGEFQLVEMPRRVLERPMPAVRTVDLRDEIHSKRSRGAISRPLHQAMEVALREGGQVILLLNRRGFSTHIQCPACGAAMKCPECDIALTFHRQDSTAVCHSCDYQVAAPSACPECQFAGLRFSGLGTQKLEAEVRARFPNYVCLRMDTDAMRERGSHAKALDAFREGRATILLGTQMIAKGLDFPNVTLVGVINADTALHLPDFRAAERTFQLVTQVAGRTGRGPLGGRVLVQTLCPETPAIQAAVRHDYVAFARAELPHRESAGYPPFTSMVRIVVRGAKEGDTKSLADELGSRLRAATEGQAAAIRILGPAPAPFAKLRGQFRYHIQLQSSDADALRSLVRSTTSAIKLPEGLNWIVDVDPWDMM
ncbi:MAG TPA: primosomal protein N' [Lacipirellulaceae bacterium]|jgi:primosomal protein N' (replication factor Y)